jgi:surface antigen
MHISMQTLCILSTTALIACTEPDGSPGQGITQGGALSKSDVGTAVGVVGGGLIGSSIGSGAGQVAATVGGVLLGGILGNSIGASLDSTDRANYDRASQRAMNTGRAQSWKNSSSSNSGTVYPNRQYVNNAGAYCREYTQHITVDGKTHKGNGVACRQNDGTWTIVE